MSLHLVIGQQDCRHYSLTGIVSYAIAGGITHVQLREKSASIPDVIELGKALHQQLRIHSIPLIINDYIEVALAINADGVHLGQTDLACTLARQIIGPDKIIGLTIETAEQAIIGNQLPVDYFGAGPVFLTQTKDDAPHPMGISGLRTICQTSQHPVIAIGGIDEYNAREVINAGAQGIAVVSAICSAEDPEAATRRLKRGIDQ